MSAPLAIAFFGSSLVSAYWNGAATYYRGIIRALAQRGHRVTFYEPDAFDRQRYRDLADPPWARVVVYPGDEPTAARRVVADARESARVIIKASGVGVYDELLEAEVARSARPGRLTVFWDVDAPATLERLHQRPGDPLTALVPRFDRILTYGGGDRVVAAYRALGARRCVPIYNALDPDTHHPAAPVARFEADLGLLANRLPDRERRVDEFFFDAARRLPARRFLLGGAGWGDCPLPSNVRWVGHVPTGEHNAFNSSCLAVLNVARDSMAATGFSPATRIFEAAGAGACIVTDAWEGVGQFLEPDREILVARSGSEVAALLDGLSTARAGTIGDAARRRVLAEHTYALRAREVETQLEEVAR